MRRPAAGPGRQRRPGRATSAHRPLRAGGYNRAPCAAGFTVARPSPEHSMSLQNPKVGFVSLGCPKALVDSERILTQLRVEGYDIVPSYDAADVVVVNTCGFIDSAVAESLDAIGE